MADSKPLKASQVATFKKVREQGEALTAGDLCYLKSDGKYWKADNTAEATAKGELVIAGGNLNGSFRDFYTGGEVGGFSSLTVGAELWMSTAGSITEINPNDDTPASGDIVRLIGWVKDATTIIFNPAVDYIKLL